MLPIKMGPVYTGVWLCIGSMIIFLVVGAIIAWYDNREFNRNLHR